MNNNLWSIISKKRHKINGGGHKEYEDYPVIFSPYSSKDVPKNLFKIDQKLIIKEVENPGQFKTKKRNTDDKLLLARSLNLGYYLIIPLLLGLFLGIWLDKLFSSQPFFLLLLFALGVVSSFYNLWKVVKMK